jgi:hypothetical protein
VYQKGKQYVSLLTNQKIAALFDNGDKITAIGKPAFNKGKNKNGEEVTYESFFISSFEKHAQAGNTDSNSKQNKENKKSKKVVEFKETDVPF